MVSFRAQIKLEQHSDWFPGFNSYFTTRIPDLAYRISSPHPLPVVLVLFPMYEDRIRNCCLGKYTTWIAFGFACVRVGEYLFLILCEDVNKSLRTQTSLMTWVEQQHRFLFSRTEYHNISDQFCKHVA